MIDPQGQANKWVYKELGAREQPPSGEAHQSRLHAHTRELHPVWDPRPDRECEGGAGPQPGTPAAQTDIQAG